MAGHRDGRRRSAGWEPRRAWGASIFVTGILLFTWPFVRTPLLALGPTYVHLLAAWLAIVLTLHAMARALGRGRRSGDRDA